VRGSAIAPFLTTFRCHFHIPQFLIDATVTENADRSLNMQSFLARKQSNGEDERTRATRSRPMRMWCGLTREPTPSVSLYTSHFLVVCRKPKTILFFSLVFLMPYIFRYRTIRASDEDKGGGAVGRPPPLIGLIICFFQ